MLKSLHSIDYHREQIELLLGAKAGALAANVLSPLLLYFTLIDFVPQAILLPLTLAQLVIFTVRMIIASKASKQLQTAEKKINNRYLTYYLMTIFGNALLLGVTGICAILYADTDYMLFVMVVLLAVTTGSISTLTPVFHAVFIFIFVSLSIFFVGLLIFGSAKIHYFLMITLFFYILIALSSSFRIFKSIHHNLKQREEIKILNASLQENNHSLREKNTNFQNLLDVTMEAVVISNAKHEIIDINKSGLELFQVDDKSIALGRNIIDFVSPQELSKLQNSLQEPISKPFEISLKKYNGDTFPALASGRGMVFNGENVRLSTILDLTQIKQKDQLLMQQSRQAAMGEMIGNIAHQWRQPLNALGLILQNIHFEYDMGMLDEAAMTDAVEKGKKLTQSMSKTIDDFRNFFKPDKTKENFLLSDVIRQTIELVEAAFRDKEIVIKLNLDNTLLFNGYPGEFSQVILNLLSNAKDALIENDVSQKEISILTYQEAEKLIVKIQDNGGGIQSEVIEKIFEPYFSTKEEGKGTGIGLYMSKNIIESNMGGTLTAQNRDHGALFTITLPKSTSQNAL